MKVERIREMPQIKREIIAYLADYISRKEYNRWWHYKGEFAYEGKSYDLECDCRMDNEYFEYKNLHIQHRQIVLDAEDVINMELSDIAKIN